MLFRSPEDIRKALNQHLCRCTGYTSIVEAIQRPLDQTEALPLPPSQLYVDDLERPGMWFAALVLPGTAGGRIRHIDMEAARAVATVVPLRDPHDLLEFPDEPVAVVVAESRSKAEAAAALVKVELQPLPAPEGRLAASGRCGWGKIGRAHV